MNFSYNDLMFFLEEGEHLPAEYYDIESALEAHAYVAAWLGYDSVEDFESFELWVEQHTDTHGTWERYSTTSIQNDPPKIDKTLYHNFINACVDHANWI
jgi:hypothetical protein